MSDNLSQAHKSHPRNFANNRYVYPVISRRSGGVSIGINLNPDKACNFNCPYCQVDRTIAGGEQIIDLKILEDELIGALSCFDQNSVCTLPIYTDIAPRNKKLIDIALSGDGEPTMVKEFEQVCAMLSQLQATSHLPFKLVLITNATLFHKHSVQRGISHLLAKNGNVWAKLDAGTEDWYKKVSGSQISFVRIQENIVLLGKLHPITIQTLWHHLGDDYATEHELDAYLSLVAHWISEGVQIAHIQFHTLARNPSDSRCHPIKKEKLLSWAEHAHKKLHIPITAYV